MGAALVWLLLFAAFSQAGVTNPDISVLGQMRTFVTDDPADVNRNRGQLSFDESEMVFDAALNPYARGVFVFAVADEGIEVEEGYFSLNRGLPLGLALKAGKYRVGFGRLNAVHPHAYPFVERPRVLAAYLPGEESFNDIGADLSYRIPFPGSFSSTIEANVLQGSSFHPDEPDESRPAVAGRWASFVPLGGPSSLDIGLSGAYGTSGVEARTTTSLFAFDAKLKLWPNPVNNLVLQSELLALQREQAESDSGAEQTTKSTIHAAGGYIMADYTMRKRYNAGLKYERFQRPEEDHPWDQSADLFAGLALMEETTLFRVVWNRFFPDDADAFNTFTLQAVFSMGPHKPHQF